MNDQDEIILQKYVDLALILNDLVPIDIGVGGQ